MGLSAHVFRCSDYSHKAHSVRMGVEVITIMYNALSGVETKHFTSGVFAYDHITSLREHGELTEIISVEGDRENRREYFIQCIHFVCKDSDFSDDLRDEMIYAFNRSWDEGNHE